MDADTLVPTLTRMLYVGNSPKSVIAMGIS